MPEIREWDYANDRPLDISPDDAEPLTDDLIEMSDNDGVPVSFANIGGLGHAMSEGDVTSNQMGTAARASTGKPRFDLMPFEQLATLVANTRRIGELSEDIKPEDLLSIMAKFQRGETYAYDVLVYAVAYAWSFQPNAKTVLDVLEDTCHVWEYGLHKYAEWNWAKGAPWRIPIGCFTRHLNDVMKAPDEVDEDSGYSHQAHIICNAMMLVHYQKYWNERGPHADCRPFQYFGHPEAPKPPESL